VCNTFSYTYPDYPLYQQYPIYQALLYAIYSIGGWVGLSLLHCALWLCVFIVWIMWAGTFRMKMLNLAWTLGLLALQRRMILRPDILSMLLFVFLLYLIDRYRAGRTWVVILFVFVQWLLVNSHQLFPLGILIQCALLVHLVVVRALGGRYSISQHDIGVPVLPVAFSLASSLLVCFFSPLGTGVVYVISHTATSLYYHGQDIQEFKRFYESGYDSLLVICATALAFVGAWRRKEWEPFESLLWLIGVAVLTAAVRGVTLYVLISVGIFARNLAHEVQSRAPLLENPGVELGRTFFRLFCVMVTLCMCAGIIYVRWVSPQRILGGTQPGLGRALGDWPYSSIKFLKQNPPPGRMINLTWYSANPLILELFPEYRVFVDPRFESYPRSFLLKAIEAQRNRAVLQELISEYQPDWMVAEIRDEDSRRQAIALVNLRTWELVHADTVFLILVRNVPGNSTYLDKHRLLAEDILPVDFLISEPDLLALQRIRMAELFRDFGLNEKAKKMIQAAEPAGRRYPSVKEALERFRAVQRY